MTDAVRAKPLPVVFACSCGRSNGRLANHLAVTLDEQGEAEMASIAAVGGKRPDIVGKARSRFPVVVIDGCHLYCARYCLASQGLQPTTHVVLTDLGIANRERAGFTPAEGLVAMTAIACRLAA
jgi:uncharacterized metal-binding protein